MKNKKVESRYSAKPINESFFGKINIENISGAETPAKKNGESGLIWAPYVPVMVNKPSKEYEKFMRKYRKVHKVCPKCGAEQHSTTLCGYVLNLEKKEEYKDLNNCSCLKCGDHHTAHERISVKEFKQKQA